MSIKIENTSTVLDGKFSRVDNFRLKDGSTEKTHLNVFRNPTVSIFPLNDEGEIFLVRHYRYLLGKETLDTVAVLLMKTKNHSKQQNGNFVKKRFLRKEHGEVQEAYLWERVL